MGTVIIFLGLRIISMYTRGRSEYPAVNSFFRAQWVVVIVQHVTPNGDIRLVEQGEYWKFSLRQGRFYRRFFVSLLLDYIEEILG